MSTAKKKTTKTAGAAKTKKTTGSRAALARAGREKLNLLERMEVLGLIGEDQIERLAGKAEDLKEAAVSEAVAAGASWDRALAAGLASFEAAGGDGKASETLHALVAWRHEIASAPATRDGITRVLTALKKVIPQIGATLLVRDPDRQTVEPLVTVGSEVELISRIRFSEGMGFSSWVAGRRQPVLYSSIHRNEAPDATDVRSFMCAPLLVGSECVGVLNLGHGTDGKYHQGWLRVLMIAAGLLAGFLHRYVALEQIRAREITDAATGIATSTYLRTRLEEEVIRCRELGHSMSFLVVRLNELDEHANRFEGDYRERCRAEMAAAVRAWARPTELAGHWEGDRLAVILPSTRREKAEARAEELRIRLESHNFPRRKRMTVGLAVAAYPGDAESAQELVDFADKSLYETASRDSGGGGSLHSVAMS